MKMYKKEGGRIPFAYVFAIIFVLLLMLSGIYASILGYHDVTNVNKFYEESDWNLRNIQDMVREKAYHIVMNVIHNITEKENPNIYMIQYYTYKEFSNYINKTFPLITQDYKVTVGNYSIKVVMDYKKTRDFVKNYRLTWVNPSYNIKVIDNSIEGGGHRNHTQLPVYPYVVGFLNYTYRDLRTGYLIKRSMDFNRIIYSPLPLLKFVFDEFNTSTTNLGDFGRLIRYILTTVAEYRTLEGYGAGGYNGINIPVTDILTKEDVEKAVNLALMLESVRFFHTYDKSVAASMGLDRILSKYARDGILDAADVYFLWNRMDNHFYVGRILGQSIYGYADRFVYAYMRLFWGNLANQYFADPTLKEPVVSWKDINGKSRGDSWCREMVHIYLDKWRQWLDIPKSLNSYTATAHVSVPFTITILIPGTPPKIIILHKTASMDWTVKSDAVPDTVELILAPNREYYTLHTIAVATSTNYVTSHTYEYNLVKISFGGEHKNYGNGKEWENVLHYVMDALTRSMKRRSNTWDDTNNKGFVDYAAYDAARFIGDSSINIGDGNPKNQVTIINNGFDRMVNGYLQNAAGEFNGLIYLRKETWWADGAYKDYKDSSDQDAYIYYLTKDTVDMWYQAMKNLYDGGYPAHSDYAGPYDSDSGSLPNGYQISTWPRSYGGYPFYGRSMYNGSFNFHRDLTRDAYHDIIAIMWVMAWEEAAKYGGFPSISYDGEQVWDTVKEQTKNARVNVVGKNGLIKDLNAEFPVQEFNQAYLTLKSYGDLRSYLDRHTDTGAYKDNFYKYIRWRMGYIILGIAEPHNGTSGGGNNSGNNTGNTTTNVTGEGIDVSHWQGTINWNEVAKAGYKFAFVKATDGTSYVDPNFVTNIQNGASAGLMMGAYHFAHPDSDSAIAEADHFVDVIKPYMGQMQLPPALDLETGSSMGWSAMSKWVNDFMNEVQSKLGVTPIIYVNVNYASHLDSSVTKWPLWIADWTYNPNATPRTGVWSTWAYWQFSDKGTVPGISGSSVDLDKANGEKLYRLMSSYARGFGTSNDILDQMSDWLSESFAVLYQNIYLNAHYSQLPVFTSVYQGRYYFWDTTPAFAEKTGRLKNETIVVKWFEPSVSASVSIGKGHRFVDVQDLSYNMGSAPFEYQFNVQLSGNLNMNLRTDRTSLVYGNHHWYTWYNGSVKFNLNLKIPIYTAWFLESHWNKCTHEDNWAFHTDVPFNYTRGYFGVDNKDTHTNPFFISEPLNRFIYDYEGLSEIWNRYSTFYHFEVINAKDEAAAWNYTYKDTLTKATDATAKAMADASSLFSRVSSDQSTLISKASSYMSSLNFFYFERDFIVTSNAVKENNGYQSYNVNLGNAQVQEKYSEGQFNAQGTISRSNIDITVNEKYDRATEEMTIKNGEISYNMASYYRVHHRAIKLLVEAAQNIYKLDFGFVGTGNVASLDKYIRDITKRNVYQEDLVHIFHKMLKDIYLNETINYKFGMYVNLLGGGENLTYIVWFDKAPTPDSFIIWLNNEVRYIIYNLGMSQFPQHGYDRLTSDSVYYSISNLWMSTNYEASSIFGYRESGDFRGASNGYEINWNFNIEVPTPDTGHGPAL